MSHQNKEFSISSWAIDNRVTVYIFTLLVVITGLIAYVTMPREDFPEIIENKVYIPLPTRKAPLYLTSNQKLPK